MLLFSKKKNSLIIQNTKGELMACTLMLFSLATQKEGIKSYKYTSLFQQDINNGNFDHLDLAITPNIK
jgi:hypothetical protein